MKFDPAQFSHLTGGVFVYDVFSDVQPFVYDTRCKQYVKDPRPPALFADAPSSSAHMQQRYHLIMNNIQNPKAR